MQMQVHACVLRTEDARQELRGEHDDGDHREQVDHLVHPVLLLVQRLVRQGFCPAHLGRGVDWGCDAVIRIRFQKKSHLAMYYLLCVQLLRTMEDAWSLRAWI